MVIDKNDLPDHFCIIEPDYESDSEQIDDCESIISISDVEKESSKDDEDLYKDMQNSCKYCDKTRIACDNDCGTFFCDRCENEWYFESKTKKPGHNPNCGHFSDEDDEDVEDEPVGRVDPGEDVIFTPSDDEESIFTEDEESENDFEDTEDDDEEENGLVVDVDPEEDEDDEEDAEDETVCKPGCMCVNCEAERAEE
jgi:hypothetical protein